MKRANLKRSDQSNQRHREGVQLLELALWTLVRKSYPLNALALNTLTVLQLATIRASNVNLGLIGLFPMLLPTYTLNLSLFSTLIGYTRELLTRPSLQLWVLKPVQARAKLILYRKDTEGWDF